VTIPINTTATIEFPTTNASTVQEGGRKAASYQEMDKLPADNWNAQVLVGSGDYDFTCEIP
jgi:hypothetical protein